jgi:hypothetical protein
VLSKDFFARAGGDDDNFSPQSGDLETYALNHRAGREN